MFTNIVQTEDEHISLLLTTYCYYAQQRNKYAANFLR